MVTDYTAKLNKYDSLTSIVIGSSNKLTNRVNIVKVSDFKIGSLIFKNIPAFQTNYDKSEIMKCTVNNGSIIGIGIIKNYIWQINYINKKIIVTDDLKKLKNINTNNSIPVSFSDKNIPYISTKINGQEHKMMFDLGCASLAILNSKNFKFDGNSKIFDIYGGYIDGINGKEEDRSNIFKVDKLEIGENVIYNQPIMLSSTIETSLLGNSIIKNFVVTLNFKDKEIYLDHINNADKGEGWKSFGMSLAYINNKHVIATIIKDSNADIQGIKPGDEILSINGEKILCNDYCDCKRLFDDLIDNNMSFEIEIKSTLIKKITLHKEKKF